MGNTFITKNLLFINCLCVIGLIIFCMACHNNDKSTKYPEPVFDLNTPGGLAVDFNCDSVPREVLYYKTDEQGNQTNEVIGEAFFYESQQEYIGGGIKDGKREGQWYAFFRDGSVQTEGFYIGGKEHGHYNVYRENGNPLFKGHFNNGICDGIWTFYDENGKQIKKIRANKNTIACEYCKKCLSLKKK